MIGCGIIGLLIFLILPMRRDARPAAYSTQCRNNLRQIGIGLYNYHDVYGSFPPAHTVDESGNRLHSWRTLILPYIEQQALYDSIDLSRPWDDPANKAAYDFIPDCYQCPAASIPDNHTLYMAIVGEECAFHPDPAVTRSSSDYRTNQEYEEVPAMIVETSLDNSVHWMSPQDSALADILALSEESDMAHSRFGRLQFLGIDGSTPAHALDESPTTRRELIRAIAMHVDDETNQ